VSATPLHTVNPWTWQDQFGVARLAFPDMLVEIEATALMP
jgi:enamine deaminase RidA (YjgF/YER057c/UK114 family)